MSASRKVKVAQRAVRIDKDLAFDAVMDVFRERVSFGIRHKFKHDEHPPPEDFIERAIRGAMGDLQGDSEGVRAALYEAFDWGDEG